ncbi:MAG: type IX secretion system membrane protein PorP/SprF [Bacteroidales bacterium]
MKRAARHIIPILGALFLLVVPVALRSQVHPLADHYRLNLFLMNPAIAGTERYAPLHLSTRQQWMGWRGAPTAQAVTLHSRLVSKKLFYNPRGFRNKGANSFGRVGVGGGFFNYSYGIVSQTGIHLDYAYHVEVGDGRLSLGLAPLFFQYRLNKSGLIFPDPTLVDPGLTGGSEVAHIIDFNAGVHYYSDRLYAGISGIQMINSLIVNQKTIIEDHFSPLDNPDLTRSAYAYAGGFIEVGEDIRIEPMVLLKYNTYSGLRADINASFHYRQRFMAGGGYRWQEGMEVFTGIQLDNLSIRYLFQVPVGTAIPNQFTSHLIQVGFNLGQPIDD